MVVHELKTNKDYKEVEECDCCGYGPVMAHHYIEGDKEGWLCDVCFHSMIGKEIFYQSKDNKVLVSMAACTNMILAKQDKILKLLRDEFYDH